MQKFCISGRK
jgi:hypothetical protein